MTKKVTKKSSSPRAAKQLAVEEPASERPRSELIAEFLAAEGFRPKIEDGDVGVKYQGSQYWIVLDEKDPEFYRVIAFRVWPIESERERVAVYAAASHVGQTTKVVKVFPTDDNVWVSAEYLAPDVPSFLKTLLRSLELCSVAVTRFKAAVGERMEQEEPPQTPSPV